MINFLEIAFHHLSRDHGLSGEQILYCMRQLNLTGASLGICKKENQDFECKNKNYQSLDGKCVNEKQKGARNTPYGRLMKNSYFNGNY